MQRDIFTADHDDFRLLVRDFIAKEVSPHYRDWEKAGQVPREMYRTLGTLGVMGMAIPEEYGGSGTRDYRYNMLIQEEAAKALITSLGTVRTQLDVILPYFLEYCDDAQKASSSAVSSGPSSRQVKGSTE